MSKNSILSIALLVSLLTVSACSSDGENLQGSMKLDLEQKSVVEPEVTYKDYLKDIQQSTRSNAAILNEVIGKADFNSCSKLATATFRENCEFDFLTMEALNGKDISICKKLDSKFQKKCEKQYNNIIL